MKVHPSENHLNSCKVRTRFTEKYSSSMQSKSKFEMIREEFMATLIDFPRDHLAVLNEFKENQITDEIVACVSKMKNPNCRKTFWLKRYPNFLKFSKGFSRSKIVKILPLTLNQLKKSFQEFKKGKSREEFVENRGRHKVLSKIIGNDKLMRAKEWLSKRNAHFTIRELHSVMSESFSNQAISISRVYRLIKSELNFKYHSLKPNHVEKNSEKNKIYRYWFVHFVMNALSGDELVIAIDETSLSSYHSKIKAWDHELLFEMKSKEFTTGIPNISLLLASSQEKIIAYYMVEGSIDSITFLDFMNRLFELVSTSDKTMRRMIRFTIDNAKIHNSLLLQSFYREKGISVIYTPKYSPEVHFIEGVLERIKKVYRAKPNVENKFDKQISENVANNPIDKDN